MKRIKEFFTWLYWRIYKSEAYPSYKWWKVRRGRKVDPSTRTLLWKLTIGQKHMTPELIEKYPGLHFCEEWDGLAIYKGSPEFDVCLCFPPEER